MAQSYRDARKEGEPGSPESEHLPMCQLGPACRVWVKNKEVVTWAQQPICKDSLWTLLMPQHHYLH